MKFKFTLALVLTGLLSQPALSQTQKNILFIAVDDLNDWTGAFGGHPQSKTPNIDALAAQGIAFQKAYSASPVCSPSRTALLTGRRPFETNIDNNSDADFRNSDLSWLKSAVSLPQYFASNGYHTEGIGKIFHTPEGGAGEFIVAKPNSGGNSVGVKKTITGTPITWSEGLQPAEQTSDWKNAEYGAQFLAKPQSKPFFLAVGIFRPHLPWLAPKVFYDAMPNIGSTQLPAYLSNDLSDTSGFSNNVLDKVLAQGGTNLWRELVRAYLANTSYADYCVGHLLKALKNSAHANNTIVVLWGDHGWHLGEKNHFQKFTHWERAYRTTFVIYDPSTGVRGNVNKAVSLQDIYPTLIDMAGLPKPSFSVRGRSLKTLVQNPQAPWTGAALVRYSGIDGIFSDRYHYIAYSKQELYDLQQDPNEWNNLANDPSYATVKANMIAAIEKMKNNNENPFGQ